MQLLFIFVTVFSFKECFGGCKDAPALTRVTAKITERITPRSSTRYTLTDVDFDKLHNYTSISVTKVYVSQLCEGMINSFTKLHTLALNDLSLTRVESRTFQNLPSLKDLSIARNRLSEISNDVFNIIPSLRIIYLEENRIKTIEAGAFAHMPNLEMVYLVHNNIAHLTGNVFTGSLKIDRLIFSFNKFKNISKNTFDDRRNCSRLLLFLDDNEIEYIDEEALNQIHRLDLSLDNNRIANISSIVNSITINGAVYFNNNTVQCVADDVIKQIWKKKLRLYFYNNPLESECAKRMKSLDEKLELETDSLSSRLTFDLI